MRLRQGAVSRPGAELFWTAGLGASLLVAAAVVPFDRLPIPLCPLRLLFHQPCPACGGTRAFVAVVRGELTHALWMNPLATLLALAAAMSAVWLLLRVTVVRRSIEIVFTPREVMTLRWLLPSVVAVNWLWLLVTRSPMG